MPLTGNRPFYYVAPFEYGIACSTTPLLCGGCLPLRGTRSLALVPCTGYRGTAVLAACLGGELLWATPRPGGSSMPYKLILEDSGGSGSVLFSTTC